MPKEPLLYARVWLSAAFVAIAVRVRDPRRVAASLASPRLTHWFSLRPGSEERLRAYARHALASVPLRPPRGPCVPLSVLLYAFLHRSVPGLSIVFAMRREGAREGHCWLERSGRALFEDEGPLAAFERIFVYP